MLGGQESGTRTHCVGTTSEQAVNAQPCAFRKVRYGRFVYDFRVWPDDQEQLVCTSSRFTQQLELIKARQSKPESPKSLLNLAGFFFTEASSFRDSAQDLSALERRTNG